MARLLYNRIGEKHVNNQGCTMEVICYRQSDDIDIRFEDGTIIEHKRYTHFKQGKIRNPNYRIGEKSVTKSGQVITIVGYNNAKDISIAFEDGTTVNNKSYENFKLGHIKKPNE